MMFEKSRKRQAMWSAPLTLDGYLYPFFKDMARQALERGRIVAPLLVSILLSE